MQEFLATVLKYWVEYDRFIEPELSMFFVPSIYMFSLGGELPATVGQREKCLVFFSFIIQFICQLPSMLTMLFLLLGSMKHVLAPYCGRSNWLPLSHKIVSAFAPRTEKDISIHKRQWTGRISSKLGEMHRDILSVLSPGFKSCRRQR